MKKFMKKFVALAAVVALSAISLAGCGNNVDNDAIVATVGDSEVTAGFANFYVRYQQSSLESIYEMYLGPDMWGMEIEEGYTYEDSTKESVLAIIEELYILEDHMEEYGVTVSEEELAAIDAAAEAFVAANSADTIAKVSGEKEIVAEYLRLLLVNTKMGDAMVADVDQVVSDDEAAQKRLRYVRFETTVQEEHTHEDGTVHAADTELTEEEYEALLAEAVDFLAAAKESDSLEAYAEEVEADSYTLTFDAESTALDEKVIAAADLLAEGEYAPVLETEAAIYIVQLESAFDEDATETEKESIVAERESERYAEIYDAWYEAAEININENVWETISIQDLKVTPVVEEAEETEE